MKKIADLMSKLQTTVIVIIIAFGTGIYLNTLSRKAWEYVIDIYSALCFMWLWMTITYILFWFKKKQS